MHTYLFVLSPPYCGSTVLWELLKTSPHVSALPGEGSRLPAVKGILSVGKWKPEQSYPWATIKEEWLKVWDLNRPILLEKSPRHFLRAKEIERVFTPSHFILIMRDPYALCEGFARRHNRRLRLFRDFREILPPEGNGRKDAMRFSAGLWVRFAKQQMKNIQELERVLHFTYEELTGRTPEIVSRITAFLPALGELDANQKFRVHSVAGTDSRMLVDMNHTKWECLQSGDIEVINTVLNEHRDLLGFFGYTLRNPDRMHDLRSALVRTKTLLLKMKNEGRETILGRTIPTTRASKRRWLSRMSVR